MPVATRSQMSATRQNNPHDGLKEKMRALSMLYEQQKQQWQRQQSQQPQLSPAMATHHPSIDLFAPAAPLAAPATAPKNHIVFSRAEKENCQGTPLSCPVKKAAGGPARAGAAPMRKLSLGGAAMTQPPARRLTGKRRSSVGEADVDREGCGATGSRIHVFVRLRPMSRKEKEAGSRVCVRIVNKKDVFLTEFASETDYLRLKRVRGRHFCFDASFPESTTQQEVYSATTVELVEGVLQGQNGTVFCYGATGAGKTYTMLGTMESPGVMVLAIKDLFAKVRQRSHDGGHSVQLSYLEIYNETVRDLLSPGRPLVLREDKQGIVAAGLTQYRAYSTDEVMRLLQQGNQNRTTEPTRANETSSRSHAILQVVAEYRVRDAGGGVVTRVGKLSLIDLAGSERALATDQRSLRSLEGANINRSLLALSSCINALVEGKRHIPYRNSKLTQLLKDSLGGACNTVMIANISPSSLSFGETQNTLHWADRAKEIKTKASDSNEEVINMTVDSEVAADQAKLVLELQKENSQLRQQLVQQKQKLVTLQAQSLAAAAAMASSPRLPSTPCSAQRKAKRSIFTGSCFSTPDSKRSNNQLAGNADAAADQVRELQMKVRDLEVEMEKLKKEHALQLKQKDEFIRDLMNRRTTKLPPDAAGGGSERRVVTRASIRKEAGNASAAGELKSPSHRFESPVVAAKKRSFWDITTGNSPSVTALNGRKTRSYVASEATTKAAPSMLLQPGFARHRFELAKR